MPDVSLLMWNPWLHYFVQIVGCCLILLAMIDVFMTVLFARLGTGPMSHRMASLLWRIGREISHVRPRWKDVVLSYVGPVYLVIQTGIWMGSLLIGFTLICWPVLGREIISSTSRIGEDFMTAFYVAGGSMITMGSGDIRPITGLYKFVAVADSLLGISVLTLTITYIIQIYSALQRRNALALTLHHSAGGSGDAVVLLANLGAGDDFRNGLSQLTVIAGEITAVYESHHFYSVLVYFRFAEPFYAIARAVLLEMELVTLIQSALNEEKHGWLMKTASVAQLRAGTMQTLAEFGGVYLPGGAPELGKEPEDVLNCWRERYHAGVDYLRKCGISVTANPLVGAEKYVELRKQWDGFVTAFAKYMEHEQEEVDPGGTYPPLTGKNREMPLPPLRARGFHLQK